jgi:hypothetical protein
MTTLGPVWSVVRKIWAQSNVSVAPPNRAGKVKRYGKDTGDAVFVSHNWMSKLGNETLVTRIHGCPVMAVDGG